MNERLTSRHFIAAFIFILIVGFAMRACQPRNESEAARELRELQEERELAR